MTGKSAAGALLLACCLILAAVCLRSPSFFAAREPDRETADRAALLVLNAVRGAEEIRTEGGRLILGARGSKAEWYAENGMLRASGEDAAPADAFFARTDGEITEVTIRKGGAERTLRIRTGPEGDG